MVTISKQTALKRYKELINGKTESTFLKEHSGTCECCRKHNATCFDADTAMVCHSCYVSRTDRLINIFKEVIQ